MLSAFLNRIWYNAPILKGQKDLSDKLDNAFQAVDLSLLTVINNKLGPQVSGGLSGWVQTISTKLGEQLPGGISGWLGKFAKSTYLDKAISFMSLTFSIHNAFMLSANFVQTTEDLMTLVIQAIGEKMQNEELQKFDVSEVIKNDIDGVLTQMLGKEQAIEWKKRISKLNRIYQAASNLLSSVESMFWGLQNLTQLIGQYQGKIGNALLKSGVVLEDSYNWMQERFTMFTAGKFKAIDDYINNVSGLQNVTDNITGITGEVQGIDQQVTEFRNQRDELTKLIQEKEPDEQKTATKVKDKQDGNREGSTSPEISITSDGGQNND